jgi:site-specific recombinase XerD
MSHMYILKRGNTYYFNRRVRTKTLRISLGITKKSEAHIIASRLFVFTNCYIRRGMNYEQIKLLAKQEAQRLHDEWLERHFNGGQLAQVNVEVEKLQQNEFQELLYGGLVAPDQIQEILAQVLYVSLREKTTNEWQRPDSLLGSLTESTSAELPSASLEHVSHYIDQYLQSRDESGEEVDGDTKTKKRNAVGEFVAIVGDLPLNEINITHSEEFRRVMRGLPPKRATSKQFKGMSVKQILALELPKDQCFSDTHVKRTLGELKSYFTWLFNRSVVTVNPFSDVTVSAEVNSYVRFKGDDLATLFKGGIYELGDRQCTVSRWWMVLLALYTGARIGELCQLRISDIESTDGVYYLSITDEDDSQKLKTSAAKRKVPVHSDLLELGFGDYVEQAKAANHDRLLPTAWTGTGKAGKTASVWFGRYRASRFPELSGENKVFHSFRHTFIQTAMEAGVDMSKLQQMVGHEPSLLGSTKTYIGEGFPVSMLAQELVKVEFPSMDLDWLQQNSWRKINNP